MADTDQKPRRWMPVFLAISLGLNLMIAGLVAGAWWSGGPPGSGPRAGAGGGPGFSPLTRALSDEDRAATRQALRDRGSALRRSRKEDRTEMARLVTALRAEPFDVTAVEEVFASQRSRASDRVAIGQAVLFERISAMSAADRAAFADRVEEEMAKRPRRGDRKKRP